MYFSKIDPLNAFNALIDYSKPCLSLLKQTAAKHHHGEGKDSLFFITAAWCLAGKISKLRDDLAASNKAYNTSPFSLRYINFYHGEQWRTLHCDDNILCKFLGYQEQYSKLSAGFIFSYNGSLKVLHCNF